MSKINFTKDAMNRPRDDSAHGRDEVEGETSDLGALFHYPSLGPLFENGGEPDLRAMRERLQRSSEKLDRIIRQGSKDEADSAARANRAIAATLELFAALEDLRGKSAR